jgi:hypothetical protein
MAHDTYIDRDPSRWKGPLHRAHDQLAMHELLREVCAAEDLDRAAKRFALAIDLTDTDEGLERVQTDAAAAILAALIDVAHRHGWRS